MLLHGFWRFSRVSPVDAPCGEGQFICDLPLRQRAAKVSEEPKMLICQAAANVRFVRRAA